MARVTTDNNSIETGIIREEDFSVIMAQAFATYGLSVVTDRALPDARDGLNRYRGASLAGMRRPVTSRLARRSRVRRLSVSFSVIIIPTAIPLSMMPRYVWRNRLRCAIL